MDLANQQFIIRKPEDVNRLEEIAFSGVKYAGRNDPPRECFYKDKAGYKRLNRGGQDILSGQDSPWGLDLPVHVQLSRLYTISKINKWADIYEDLHNAGK